MRRLVPTVSPLVLVLLALVTACRYTPTPIQLVGTQNDLAALAGEWSGDYSGIDSDRKGTIFFSLRAGADSAYGDVVMVAQDNWIMGRPTDAPWDHLRHARSAQALAIRFVRVRGGSVSGTLEAYLAPDCDCLVTTTFTGRVQGAVASGTFVTRTETGWTQQGRWRVDRK